MAPSEGRQSVKERRRLLNFVTVAAALLVVGVLAVVYWNFTAHRQDVIIAQLRAQNAQLQRQQDKLQRQQLAACGAAADLGSVPIPDKPAPSRLAIRLVTDNRGQWYGLGCPGSLPIPPGLAHWGARYGIPVNGKGTDVEIP